MGSSKTVDVVIVGAGIAGLYAAWKLKAMHPELSYVILESTSHIGGRARTHEFGGVHAPMGAGIGRMRDVKLKRLLRSLGMDPAPSPKVVHLQTELLPCRNQWQLMWQKIQGKAHEHSLKGSSFREACYEILGEDRARLFITLSGYTDYLDADMTEVVK